MTYPNDTIINKLSPEEFAKATGTSVAMARWWLDPSGGNLATKKSIRLGEFKTSRCDDCQEVITVYEDIEWRLMRHKIRCDDCARIAREEHGYTDYESYYVM